MMRRRVGILLLTSVLVVTPGFPPSAVTAQEATGLGGVTHFAGGRPGTAVVHLPKAVEVSTSPFSNRLTSIHSTGRVAGLVLKQDVPKDGIEVVALSVALCPRRPCEEKRLAFTLVWDPAARGFPRKVTLPAGNYFVYLVAERQTAVDLNLPGLTGDVMVPLSATNAVDIAAPRATFDPLPDHNVYSAEAKQKLEGIGWALMAIEMEADSQIYGDIETCLQRNKANPVLQHASIPFLLSSCNGSGAGSTFVGAPTGRDRTVIVALSTVARGTYFHSLAYKTVADLEEVNALALDVSLPPGKRTGGLSAGVFHSDN